jgi:hypothetical protein
MLSLITTSVVLDGIATNARGVRTERGGAWHPSTARNLLVREIPGDPVSWSARLARSRREIAADDVMPQE